MSLPATWKNSSVLKLQVTSMRDNDSGKQFLFSCEKLFQKRRYVSKENNSIKNVYIDFACLKRCETPSSVFQLTTSLHCTSSFSHCFDFS